LDDPAALPLNDLDPQLIIYGVNGNLLAIDLDSADGKNAQATFLALADGSTARRSWAESGAGEYLLDMDVANLVLIGDYNRDGFVDAADYTVWRDLEGRSCIPRSTRISDGDGDGVISQTTIGLGRRTSAFAGDCARQSDRRARRPVADRR